VQFLTEWVTNIILFILLATVIDMLLPNSSLQKYTKIVTGLLLIAIILTPVMKLISKDFETTLASALTIFEGSEEKNIENLIDLKKKEIQASTHAYILEQMAVQLKQDTEEELMEQYGFTIESINLTVDDTKNATFPDNLQKVIVHLKQSEVSGGVVEVVQKVEINTGNPLPSKRLTSQSEEITSLLAGKWNVSENAIEVLIEGEVTDKDGS
jgi:stage III sporulation protein AF